MVALGVALSLPWQGAAAATLEVRGMMKMTFYGTGDGPHQHLTNWFSATIDGSKSRIRTGTTAAGDPEYFEYGNVHSDGSYLLVNFPTNHLITSAIDLGSGTPKEVTLPSPVKPLNEAMMIINPDAVPEYGYGYIAPVWLAYASSRYLSEVHQRKLTPILSMGQGFREYGGKVRAERRMNPEFPFLPRAFVDYRDGKEYGLSGSRLVSRPLPKPFGQETTNAVYEALTWTNANGFTIPLSFRLTRYYPRSEHPESLSLAETYEGCATQILSTAEELANPVIPAATLVTEHRFQQNRYRIHGYTYNTSDGRILDPAAVAKRKGFTAQMEAALSPAHPGQTRPILYCVLGIILAIPAILAWSRLHSSNVSKQITNNSNTQK
jgi:hypothetical protein